MKLYHGTTAKHLEAVLSLGLIPRFERKSTWDMASRKDCVYLTTAYAPYFAINAIKDKGDGLMLVEVETDLLPDYFVPDEDFLEQAMRKSDNMRDKTMKQRTAAYRNKLQNFIGTDIWKKSAAQLGTCAFAGSIPSSAITRIAVADDSDKALLPILSYCLGPSITTINYQLCGGQYRDLTQWFFTRNHREFLAAREQDMLTMGRIPMPEMWANHTTTMLAKTPRTSVRVFAKKEIAAKARHPAPILLGVDASQGAGIAQR
jgi:hypothetical protein